MNEDKCWNCDAAPHTTIEAIYEDEPTEWVHTCMNCFWLAPWPDSAVIVKTYPFGEEFLPGYPTQEEE